MKQYLDLISHVLQTGVRKENRTGVDTISTFGYFYKHDFKNGFPLLTTKKMYWKAIVIELLWLLSKTNKVDFLHKHGVHFWDPWLNDDGTVNSPYNFGWRAFDTPQGPIDQIEWVINKLKTKPNNRDIVVSAWQPHIAYNPPTEKTYWNPCCTLFILNVQDNKLCLHLSQRSADVIIGIPFNLASYSLLCHLFARFSNLQPGEFGHTLIDAHIYVSKEDGSQQEYNHIPGALEQLKRKPLALPKLKISDKIKTLEDVEKLLHPSVSTDDIMKLFVLQDYKYYPSIKFKPAV